MRAFICGLEILANSLWILSILVISGFWFYLMATESSLLAILYFLFGLFYLVFDIFAIFFLGVKYQTEKGGVQE